MGWRCWPQFYQREGLHPGRRTPPGPEGAPRPQRQGDGALLRGGPLHPQRRWKARREDRHLEGGVVGAVDHVWKWTNFKVGDRVLPSLS